MKLKQLSEAKYHGATVIVESWDDDGQILYRMSPKDVKTLQRLAEEPIEHQDTSRSGGGDGFTDQERRIFKEINEIFNRAEKLVPDVVFDHYNVEFKSNR